MMGKPNSVSSTHVQPQGMSIPEISRSDMADSTAIVTAIFENCPILVLALSQDPSSMLGHAAGSVIH
jgi:hypothetical protein